jgi:hypothetical protein
MGDHDFGLPKIFHEYIPRDKIEIVCVFGPIRRVTLLDQNFTWKKRRDFIHLFDETIETPKVVSHRDKDHISPPT